MTDEEREAVASVHEVKITNMDYMLAAHVVNGMTPEEAHAHVYGKAMGRLKHNLKVALRTARQEGLLSQEDIEEAWRLIAVSEIQDELSSPKVPFISL